MLGVGYTQYICNFQLLYTTAAWHTIPKAYHNSVPRPCHHVRNYFPTTRSSSTYIAVQVHTYHNDTEEPPTTAEVWHWSKLCSGFTQAGTVNFHPRQQVCLMAVSPLSDVRRSRIDFFASTKNKRFLVLLFIYFTGKCSIMFYFI